MKALQVLYLQIHNNFASHLFSSEFLNLKMFGYEMKMAQMGKSVRRSVEI